MARLFTISFPFEQKQYDAEITVDDAAETPSISVFLPDKTLHRYIPYGKTVLLVDEQQTVAPPDNAPAAERLMQTIVNAFKAHEDQSPPVNMW